MASAMEMPSSPLFVPTAHTKRLEGTLVAPRKKKIVPNHLADTKLFGRPSSCTGALQIQPSTVHFRGFNVGSTYRQIIRIVNSSRINQSMHIIPPDSDYFKIKYSKKTSSVVPGLSLNVMIEFKPTHWRHYTDCVRIHCKGENNMLIPIHGFLVANTSSFPRNLNFPPTPVGQAHTKWLSLRSDVPVDFEFRLSCSKTHSAFTVDPMTGTIPKNGDVKLKVIFTPIEFQTATMDLQLEVSQFDFVPLLCSVTGTSTPGLSLEQLKLQLQYTQHHPPSIPSAQSSHVSHPPPSELSSHLAYPQEGKLSSSLSLQSAEYCQPLEPSSQHLLQSQSSSCTAKESQLKQPNQSSSSQPIESSHIPQNVQFSQPPQASGVLLSARSSFIQSSPRSYQSPITMEANTQGNVSESRKQLISGTRVKSSVILSPGKKQDGEDGIYMDGFHVPANLNTHSAVRKILLQEPGKLKASQLRRAGEGDAVIAGGSTRQIKEAGFLQTIKQISSDEKANLFRWVTHMGGSPPTPKEEQTVVEEREELNTVYQQSIHISVNDLLWNQHATGSIGRTRRVANQIGSQGPENAVMSFDSHRNNLWTSCLHAQQRFVQAVRKAIVRFRAQANLEKLMRLRKLVTGRKSLQEAIGLMYPKRSSIISVASLLHPLPHEFLQFSFPKFSGQVKTKDGLKRSLDQDPVHDKDISLPDLKEDVCFLDLEVPQQSYLLGYAELLTPKAGSYVPTVFNKQFLSGAEGETESLGHIPGVNPTFLSPDSSKPLLENPLPEEKSAQKSEILTSSPSPAVYLSETSSSLSLPVSADRRKTQPEIDVLSLIRRQTAPEMGRAGAMDDMQDLQKEDTVNEARGMEKTSIAIPASLLELPMPSARQILDPSPEVIDYFSMLPNSEAQLDHTLLPLPLYNSSRYPIVRLDPLDVIPGLMTWKKFSSPCLSALEKEKKLSSCWKPCRTDPFFTAGLLPQEHVESVDMMTGPLKEDMVNAERSGPPMKMETMKSIFYVPSPFGSKEESSTAKKQGSMLLHEGLSELEEHHFKSFNQLGDAIKSRLDAFLDLSADVDTQ